MEKSPETLAWVAALFNDPTKTIIFHNAKFDLEMFSFEGIDVFNIKAKVHCTLIISKLYHGALPSYELKWLASHFCGRSTEDKDEIIEWLKANKRRFRAEYGRDPNFSDAPRDVVKRRAIWDVESTLYLHSRVYPAVLKRSPELLQTELDLMFVVVDMELRGIEVDITRARELREEALRDRSNILRKLNAIVGEITVTRKRKGVEVEEVIPDGGFNPASSQHKIAAWKKLGIPLKYKTKPKKQKDGTKKGGGSWCFDEYAMMRYVSPQLQSIMRESGEEGWKTGRFIEALVQTIRKHKLDYKREMLPPLILKANALQKLCTTYYDRIIADAIDRRIEPSGREVGVLHCKFNQAEARTGRFSSSEPNMQNMPRILGPRECFIPRRGRRNWHIDYSQVEMRFFAHFARDKDMTKAIEDDIHRFVASQIYNKPESEVTKEQRKRGKSINFGIIYGAQPPKIAETLTRDGLVTTTSEAARLVGKYHRRFPSIGKLMREYDTQLARDKYVTNPFGRRYYIARKLSYTVLNYMCQGSSADLMKQAMVKVWKYLRSIGSKAKILLQVHDELGIEIPPKEEATLVPKIMQLMRDRKSFFVPIEVDAEVVTKRWSQKQKPADIGLTLKAA